MSFDSLERSRFLGRPVHLFIFRRQGLTWRFAAGNRDVSVGEHTYVAANIARDDIQQTSERTKDELKIRFDYLLDPAASEFPPTQSLGDVWRPYIPSDPVSVVCLATHFGSPDPPVVEWMGLATQPVYSDTECELTCEPDVGGDATNQGAKWQVGCWKTFLSTGKRGCNKDPEAVKVVASAVDVDGLTVSSAAFAASPHSLAGGSFYWTRGDGVVEERPIMAHTGSTIQLLYGGAGLADGIDGEALPNCAQTWAACEVYENTAHYGGAIYKPVKSPFEGVSMSWG